MLGHRLNPNTNQSKLIQLEIRLKAGGAMALSKV